MREQSGRKVHSGENDIRGRVRQGLLAAVVLAVLFLSACSLRQTTSAELAEQFAETAEHRIGNLQATQAAGSDGTGGENGTDGTDEAAGSGEAGGTQASMPTPSPTPTPTSTPTPTPTLTPTPTPTNTPSPTPILGTYSKNGSYEEAPAFTGKSFVITDASTGEVILAKDSGMRIYPASTIKMLTALTALDYMDMVNEITSSAEVLAKVESDATQYGAVAGMKLPLSVWMHMLLIPSYADAANTIAVAAGGSVEGFVKLMNQKASALGLSQTHADNAIGLDVGNGYGEMYSTAEDIAKLTRAFMKNSALAAIVAKKEFQVPDTAVQEGKLLESTNYYLTHSDLYHSDYFTSIGTKSGMTDEAGFCYAATVVTEKGKKYICCYFGAKTKSQLFTEMTALLEYVCRTD